MGRIETTTTDSHKAAAPKMALRSLTSGLHGRGNGRQSVSVQQRSTGGHGRHDQGLLIQDAVELSRCESKLHILTVQFGVQLHTVA